MVSPGEVSARNHVFELNEKVFVEKEGEISSKSSFWLNTPST